MSRPLLRRSLAALALAAFLFGSVGTALGAHRCPHHGAVGPHAVAAAPPAHHGHEAPAPDDHPPCTCLGTCHGAATVAAPAGPAPVREVEPPVLRPVQAPVAVPAQASLHPYLLPYGNAPPRG